MKWIHYKRNENIAELFMEDRKALNPLLLVPFEVFRLELVKADNYGKVKYGNIVYSTIKAFATQQLWLKSGAHEVIHLGTDYKEIIIRHERLFGTQEEAMKWAPYLD